LHSDLTGHYRPWFHVEPRCQCPHVSVRDCATPPRYPVIHVPVHVPPGWAVKKAFAYFAVFVPVADLTVQKKVVSAYCYRLSVIWQSKAPRSKQGIGARYSSLNIGNAHSELIDFLLCPDYVIHLPQRSIFSLLSADRNQWLSLDASSCLAVQSPDVPADPDPLRKRLLQAAR